jgi:hypothetical protein
MAVDRAVAVRTRRSVLRSPDPDNKEEGRDPGVRHLGVRLSSGFVRVRLADCLEDHTSRDDVVEPARKRLAGVANPERLVFAS